MQIGGNTSSALHGQKHGSLAIYSDEKNIIAKDLKTLKHN